MCGRFTQKTDPAEWSDTRIPWTVQEGFVFKPRFNVAPTQPALVVPNDKEPRIQAYRWGLVPFWATKLAIGNNHINARAETLATKAAFKDAFVRRRCVVIADGFYEWKRQGKKKQPFYIDLRNGEAFVFAGLWDRWKNPETGEWIRSFTIITAEPNELVGQLHNRMPVVLDPSAYEAWLSPERAQPGNLQELLAPYPADRMRMREISLVVNSPENDGPECLDPPSADEQRTDWSQVDLFKD